MNSIRQVDTCRSKKSSKVAQIQIFVITDIERAGGVANCLLERQHILKNTGNQQSPKPL